MKYLLPVLVFCSAIGLASPAKAENIEQPARYHSESLETVATFGEYQPIGLSVSSDNRVFVSFPNRGNAYEFGLTEIVDGEKKPFPNAAWNEKTEQSDTYFQSVQDLFVDANDDLWVLDSKPAPRSNIFGGASKEEAEGYFKLIRFDIKTGEAKKIYHFNDLDKTVSALNDVRVDTKRAKAYLSDPGQAAIVVLDLETGISRSVLKNTPFTKAKDDIVLSYEGHEMRSENGTPFSSSVNGIALGKDFTYFYFKPINDKHLYRIEAEKLADPALDDAALAASVVDLGEVGITHGLVEGPEGNVYLTTSEDYSISYIDPAGKLHTLVQDSRLIWPDSLGTGSDGYLYFSCAQLQREAQWNNGVNKIEYPYAVYRVKLPQQ